MRPARFALLLMLLVALSCSSVDRSSEPAGDPDLPPAGFSALFDGTSLGGWWGCSTEDPRAWQSLPPEQLAAQAVPVFRAGVEELL